ncbi:MAG: hypothetical protein A2912_05885 [Candidatus Buchananbacteria bacterium RIFCSPLOWO2_01_FULL_40_23b]|uniref:CN hydrolase domain-containing protein n=1 Tax=Candidatus Buchananbacteria bacterium RIFCSPLOWO2_01_FULL_40_23b TaxID=1797544 RepID=A0A1G1YUT3_9BACT|nr:MAG: hypothetical protein A2912_05885 [Candidatus Buchananbacteria bacterium RIFCSPLOWO2_01_FULL_40_23b]
MSESISENLGCARELVHEAVSKGAEIVCLPELFSTRYFAQSMEKRYFRLAEKESGETTNFLLGLARESKVLIVGGSFYELGEEEKRYNTCLVVDSKGEIAGKYRKIHIPSDPFYWEQFYFSDGNLGYVQVQHEKAKIAPLICYDQWFPEAARANVLAGAEVLFYPTAIGWFEEMKEKESNSRQRWEDAIRSHASLNGVYTVAVNRAWVEGDLNFWGGSFVADPNGEVLYRCAENRAEVAVVEIDLNKVTKSQQSWGFLGNRKPKSYDSLTRVGESKQ